MPAPHDRRTAKRRAAALGIAAIAAVGACFYPDYTFNEQPGSAGGSGGSGPSSGGAAPQSGTGGASSSASSTGVGGKLGEICDNGIDDDGDGLIDCEDQECTDFACVGDIPSDWSGYFALYDGALGGDPGCPAAFPSDKTAPYIGNAGIDAPPATCAACTCGNPTGQSCTPPTGFEVNDAACNVNPNCVTQPPVTLGPPNGSCYNGPGTGDYLPSATTCGQGSDCTNGTGACSVSVNALDATVSGGQCAASGGTPTVDAPTWMKLGRACGDPPLTGAGCNAGQVCLPKPPSKFVAGVCVSHAGDVGCPSGAFAQKHLFFAGSDDTRGCTACQCGSAAGGKCGTITLYSNSTCTTSALVATLGAGDCVALNGNPTLSGRKLTMTAPSGGSCPPSGGDPTGDATPNDPTTFCCIP